MRGKSRVALSVAALACFSFLSTVSGLSEPLMYTGLSNYTFPEEFIFGVATSAYQIEGGWNLGGKGESMWDTHLHKYPNYTVDGSNADIAADSYHLYKEDVKMVQYLGLTYYRLSMSWPRLLPRGTDNYISEDGKRYYRNVFEELLKANITPVVTLFHWDLPTPLMDLGGWNNPRVVDYFEDYARVAFELFGDVVKIWTTMNEPHQHCYNGYGGTQFAPALNAHGIGEYLCTHYMLLAHAKAYHLYDKVFRPKQNGQIGITLDSFWAEPKNASDPEDVAAAENYLQMHLGIYANPIFNGDYPDFVRQRVNNMSIQQGYTRSRLPYFSQEEVKMLKGSSDFFGLNHYASFLMSPCPGDEYNVPSMDHDTGVCLEQHPNWPKPGAVWFSVNPEGFRKLLNWVNDNYIKKNNMSIIVTENGLCDLGGLKDYARISYHKKYLYQLLLAKNLDNINIQGYFAWTLMDVFEWTDGYTSKFGLFHVDFESPERTRTPKLSAQLYKQIVKTRQIDFEFLSPESSKYQSNKL
ncbi:myrosinase 1-like [Ostrinia furnacalis]|uniref:myrosinase 1-like n=1 Tax=Ostrinia furnacalis TaxID=93504 RepID=UPI001039EE70|nr:myrosinase 1-like [Ostrinia furnacalis]